MGRFAKAVSCRKVDTTATPLSSTTNEHSLPLTHPSHSVSWPASAVRPRLCTSSSPLPTLPDARQRIVRGWLVVRRHIFILREDGFCTLFPALDRLRRCDILLLLKLLINLASYWLALPQTEDRKPQCPRILVARTHDEHPG
jgi:hypothetical protein